MIDNLRTETQQPSLASLVNGIITDAQDLIRQEMALARREVQEEVEKAKVAVVSFGVGLAVSMLGGLMLCFMIVYLLKLIPDLPLWLCFGIVCGLFLLGGAFLFYAAMAKIRSISLVPRQTVETMKENVRWLKNQT